MSKLPALTSQQVIGMLRKAGFYISHQKGSHVKLRDHVGHTTIVPFHRRDIKRGLLKRIIKDSGLSDKEFLGFR